MPVTTSTNDTPKAVRLTHCRVTVQRRKIGLTTASADNLTVGDGSTWFTIGDGSTPLSVKPD